MKAVAGILGALVGVAIVALIGMLIFRHPVGASTQPGQTGQSAQPPGDAEAPPRPNQPLHAPLTREEQLKQDLDRQREPYYHFLLKDYGDKITRFWVQEDYDTLDMAVNQTDDATLSDLVQRAVAPSAKDYGFRRVRFYGQSNDPTHPYQLIAEATQDDVGRWNIFRK